SHRCASNLRRAAATARARSWSCRFRAGRRTRSAGALPDPAYRGPPSERGLAAVDHKAVGGVIGRGLAHDVDRDAAEIGWLAEAAHGNARHHIGDEFLVGHDAGGHVAL